VGEIARGHLHRCRPGRDVIHHFGHGWFRLAVPEIQRRAPEDVRSARTSGDQEDRQVDPTEHDSDLAFSRLESGPSWRTYWSPEGRSTTSSGAFGSAPREGMVCRCTGGVMPRQRPCQAIACRRPRRCPSIVLRWSTALFVFRTSLPVRHGQPPVQADTAPWSVRIQCAAGATPQSWPECDGRLSTPPPRPEDRPWCAGPASHQRSQ
jgi:hypothetical protein